MGEKKKILKKILLLTTMCILICIYCASITPVTLENDTYYSIKLGEHIQETGIDMQDPFSWHENLEYTYPHWLYDVLTYKIYSNFGFEGIYTTTVILACILGLSVFFVNCKLAKNKIISFFITIGVMFLIKGYITARAQLVTFILFVFAILFIEKFLENKKIWYVLGLTGISVLIANLHAAVWPFLFVLFLPYIGECIIAFLADFIIYKKFKMFLLKFRLKHIKDKDKKVKIEDNYNSLKDKIERVKIKRNKNLENPYKIKLVRNKNVKWLILVMIICALAGLLTPIGDTPYTYLYKTMQGNTTENINEHLPMVLSSQIEPLCAIVIILSIMIFTKVKIRLKDLFMIGGLCYLMLLSRRQLSMFALIGSIILNKSIYELIRMYDNNDIIGKMGKTILKPIFAVFIMLYIINTSHNNFVLKAEDEIVDKKSYPVDACTYILENLDLSKVRLYNEYNYGSYMLFRGIPVFIDSRADLYAPEFSGLEDDIFMDFIDVSSIGTFYDNIFGKYNITHAIMYKNAKISMIIDKTNDSRYKKIYTDDNFVIYERIV